VGVYHSFITLPSPATPTLLQHHCTTIAQYKPSHRPSLCMPYTIQYWGLQYRVKAKVRMSLSLSILIIQKTSETVFFTFFVSWNTLTPHKLNSERKNSSGCFLIFLVLWDSLTPHKLNAEQNEPGGPLKSKPGPKITNQQIPVNTTNPG